MWRTPGADLLELLDRFADAWNRHDLDALMAMMTDDCVFESFGWPLGQRAAERGEGGGACRIRRGVRGLSRRALGGRQTFHRR